MLVRSDVREPRIVTSRGAAAPPAAAARDPVTVNDLMLRLWTGQANHRVQFDCGEGCLSAFSAAEVRSIDSLCFSRLYIDHTVGFDGSLRPNSARPDARVLIDEPEGTTRAIRHRLRGVAWHLIAGRPGRFRVTDILRDRMVTLKSAGHSAPPDGGSFMAALAASNPGADSAVHHDPWLPSHRYRYEEVSASPPGRADRSETDTGRIVVRHEAKTWGCLGASDRALAIP